jgi:hypothetical protein
MAVIIQRFVDIDVGTAVSAGLQTLGQFNEQNPDEQYRLCKLRAATTSPMTYSEKLQAILTTPGGIEIGPIDIPFTYNVETPVSVRVICPSRSSVQQRVMLILSDLPDSPNLYGATYLAQPQQNADTPLFDQVVACTVYPSAGVLTFKDGAGNVIATATGSQLIARPRFAKTVASNSATPAILFHY